MHREKKIRKILFDGQKENSGSQILTSEFDIYFFKAVHSFTDLFCFANAEGKLAATKILEIVFRTLSKHMESVHEKLNYQQK